MKKIISFILILIVCLSVPQLAYAEETPIRNNISFSDSLTEIKDKETLKLSKKDSDKSHLSYEGKIDGYTSFIDYYFNDKGNLSDIIYKTVFNDGYNVRASNTAPRELYDFYYNLFDTFLQVIVNKKFIKTSSCLELFFIIDKFLLTFLLFISII